MITPPDLLPAEKLLRKTTLMSQALAMVADISISTPKAKFDIPKLRPPMQQIGSSCVGFSLTNYLNTDTPRPFYNLGSDFAVELWKWAKKYDNDPDTDPADPGDGTDVGAAGKRLKKLGYITKSAPFGIIYERELRKHILEVGPTVIAIPWFNGFDIPTDGTKGHGLIKLSGSMVGGHAILCYWFEKNRYWLYQTWKGYGPYDKYGQIVEISAKDMKRLFNKGGYAMKMEKNPNKQM